MSTTPITRRTLLAAAAAAPAMAAPRPVRAQAQTTLRFVRDGWLQTPALAGQQPICRDIHALDWEEAPCLPLGEYKRSTACRQLVTGVLDGTAVVWNVRPA